MRTHECTKTVGSQLHRTGTSIILFTPTNGQNAGDLMPNAGRREKGPKCESLPLNAGELAALHTTVFLIDLDANEAIWHLDV